MLGLSHPHFNHPNHRPVLWKVRIVELHIMQLSPFSYYLLSLSASDCATAYSPLFIGHDKRDLLRALFLTNQLS
jgi:hypothetical protein